MGRVRVLVGTRKGAFILTSDGKRKNWDVSGPLFGGWEMYHLKGSPADPNRLYASQSSGWFGQIIQRSDDGGKTWHQPGTPPGEPTTTPDGMLKGESNKFVYDTSPPSGKPLTTHQWYDGTQHPWEFKRVWHLEPSLSDPDTVYAGVEDAAIFRTTDGGKTWNELAGLRGHPSGPKWQPGAGDWWHGVSGDLTTGFGCPIGVHARGPDTVYVVPIKSGSEHFPLDGKLRVYRSRTGGNEWGALTRGLPQRDCYVNILRDAMSVDSLDSCGVYFGTTGGQVYASANSGNSWTPIVRDLPAVLSVEVQTLK